MKPVNNSHEPHLYERYRDKSWWARNNAELIVIIGGLCLINLIFIASVYREGDTVDAPKAGQLGDFVGGYIGTIFTLVSVVLLYSTLKLQRISSSVEKFETKFFELIKIHRDNVAEMKAGKRIGKKVFVLLVREFRETLKVAKQLNDSLNLHYNNKDLCVVSYYGLFFGVGPNSSRMLKASLNQFDQNFVVQFEAKLNDNAFKEKIKIERKFGYTPFEGHQSRLGHYYRHLFQTVSYVDKQAIDIDKYEFVKNLRAQLTTHEQALLFINCITPMGAPWFDNGLLLRYRFVRNIPFSFFDSNVEIDIPAYFPSDYFEWQERVAYPQPSENKKP